MDKPPFDPSKSFNPVASNDKPEFDPSKSFEPVATSNAPGEAQTALEHGANMATMGYLPQLQAAARPAIYTGLNAIQRLRGKSEVEPSQEDLYVNARDANIKRLQDEESANPKSALAGKLGGGLIGAVATPLPELGLGKGIIPGAVKGAVYGAGQGAISNPGDTKGEVNPLQLDERGENAVKGAEFGGAAGAAGGLIGNALNKLQKSPEALSEYAGNKAVKASGGMLKDFRALDAKNKTGEIGQFALDNGIVKAGDTVEDIANKADSFNQTAGKKLQSIYEKAKSKLGNLSDNEQKLVDESGFNPTRDKQEIIDAAKSKLGNAVGKKTALAKISNYLDDLIEEHGDKTLDPKQANDIKSAIDKEINYSRNPLNPQPHDEVALSAVRQAISSKIDSGIDALGTLSENDKSLSELKQANRDYGMSAQLKKMAEDRVSRESANRAFGLTDTIAGGSGAGVGAMIGHHAMGPAGGAAGAAVGGLIGGAANRAARTYGPAIQADVANKLAPVAENVLAPIGKFGNAIYNPNAVARTATEVGLLKKKAQ